ncbi:MAG: hypothetical protein AAF491_05735, partial [Verrucomicrobiota bacterium]
FDETLADLRDTLESINGLMDRMEGGEGLADALLNDEELRRDLSNFVDKLERNGILFYPRERRFFGFGNGKMKESGTKSTGKP